MANALRVWLLKNVPSKCVAVCAATNQPLNWLMWWHIHFCRTVLHITAQSTRHSDKSAAQPIRMFRAKTNSTREMHTQSQDAIGIDNMCERLRGRASTHSLTHSLAFESVIKMVRHASSSSPYTVRVYALTSRSINRTIQEPNVAVVFTSRRNELGRPRHLYKQCRRKREEQRWRNH